MLLLALLAATPEPVLLDRAAVIVDERAISASALAERKGALQELVDEALIAAAAQQASITADDAEIDRALDDVAKQNSISREELENAVAQQGLTMDGYRERLRAQIREMKFVMLKQNFDARPRDQSKFAEWMASERERLVAALRAKAKVEVRDERPFSASGPADGGCPTSLSSWSPSDGGLTGLTVARICMLGLPPELQAPLTEVFQRRMKDPLSLSAAREDVEALIASGVMRDARVLALPLDAKRVALLYAVQLYEPIVHVTVNGSTPRLGADVEPGSRLGPARIARAAAKLEDAHRELGWMQASVATRLEAADAGTQLVFDVTEGERTVISAIKFKGNKVLTTATLLAALHSRVGGPHSPSLAERDFTAITTLFYDYGLLDGRAGNPVVKKTARGLELTYPITEGPVHRVRKVTVKGWPKGREAEVLPKLECRPGRPFSRSSFQGDVERIVYQAHQHGMEVAVKPDLEVDKKAKAVDVTFDMVIQPKTGTDF